MFNDDDGGACDGGSAHALRPERRCPTAAPTTMPGGPASAPTAAPIVAPRVRLIGFVQSLPSAVAAGTSSAAVSTIA
jgi:hypothetical protein